MDGTERGRKERRDRRLYMVGVMRNKYRERARRSREAERLRAEARRRAAVIPSEETIMEGDEGAAQEDASGAVGAEDAENVQIWYHIHTARRGRSAVGLLRLLGR
jgi:hypothetical protein